MSDQSQLEINDESKLESVETYKFEPIKGYPMLHWKGKRPFTSTQFYPAQLKENHGEPVDGWMNRLYWGDNLQVMSHLLKEFRGKVRLIYIDPPYDSNADYKLAVKLRGKTASSSHSGFEEKQYTDIWINDEYLQFMYERLILMRELLAEDGSVFVHCDHRKSHHLRMLLDEVFGPNQFVNEIIWKSTSFTGSSKTIANKFPVNHNTIFWYCKKTYVFNKPRLPYSEEYLQRFTNPDNDPNGTWQSVSLKTYSTETFERLKAEGALIAPKKAESGWRYKFYLKDAKGKVLESLWTDIHMANSMASSRTGYPTQKPEELLDRIIQAASNEGDLVFDCFMGSGTTQAVAAKAGRRFIGADINLGSIMISTKRILKTISDLKLQGDRSPGFSVLNVNQYDLFRNPIEAKEILVEALEVQPIPNSTLYDGEKDGRMVRIMPVNRIATKADLNSLITGFDYKSFQKKKESTPNKPVESLLLICMGHEPDLAAHLKRECHGFELDVEVVDILRDRANLEFKRDSEAEIVVEKGKLKIAAFYPMNLLQKLSLQKEKICDWRELTESVMIDWNYDGGVFEPTEVDVPEKNEMVKGEYVVPRDSGTIRVKITDLLSESLEMEVSNGDS
ncbi:site-specific DNA-methyltransferase [Luteolibacter sp. SL250]|uniref:site-specific DNA-methyltransferase n=1 Tax=Luteolibacter sp. SL250 TaxID=2995170 RepID=UPI00226E51C8|nr:site-specific DNA-methyltransferase [Luteolibacter sp. SL250]WAC19045.1 site-specific DNA-methyltransferase [Luteolibacter sp. SL250]